MAFILDYCRWYWNVSIVKHHREKIQSKKQKQQVYTTYNYFCANYVMILFPDNNGANNIDNNNVQQQPLYEIDINEGIGTVLG